MSRRGMSSTGVRRWKNFEREVARKLRRLAPGAKRCLQYQREHGAPDVAAGVLWVECKSGKRGKRASVETVYSRTARKARARKGAVPAVVSRTGARGPQVVTLALEDFIRIAGAPDWARQQMWRGKP